MNGEHVLALYFFRDTQLQYEEYCATDMNTKCIELVASFNNVAHGGGDGSGGDDTFYMGFIECVRQLCTKINLDFRLIQIVDIGAGNNAILRRWNVKNTPIMSSYLAYYFFNYCWKCPPHKVMVIL
jgi:hypothetical protein